MGTCSMTTKMEQYILDNWEEYERKCKAECKAMAQHTGHKRNEWMQNRNVYYGKPSKARLYPRDIKREERCLRLVDLHNEGHSLQSIADIVGWRKSNVARVLKQRGYEPNVR